MIKKLDAQITQDGLSWHLTDLFNTYGLPADQIDFEAHYDFGDNKAYVLAIPHESEDQAPIETLAEVSFRGLGLICCTIHCATGLSLRYMTDNLIPKIRKEVAE